MAFLIWLVFLVCLALAALYIRVSYIGNPQARLGTKALASLGFVVLGLLCAGAPALGPGRNFYAVLMVLGLISGAVGDVLLAYQDIFPQKKATFFQAGLGAFLLGHLFYIVLLLFVVRTTWLQPLLALVLFGALWVAQYPAQLDFGRMRMPVIVYAAVLCVMTAYAISAAFLEPCLQSGMLLAGGLLFAASDAVLAVIYFGRSRQRSLRAFNLGAYYLAQILLAMSIWLR